MKTWHERIKELNLINKPLTKALLSKTAADLDDIERKYNIPLNPYDTGTLEEMIEMAVAADIFNLLFPSLMLTNELEVSGDVSFPKDRVLTFVCGIWFFTTVIPRLEEEGCFIDVNKLVSQLGSFLFMPYDDEKRLGLTKTGIHYWKALCAQPPPAIVEWHEAFSQMIFIHYEQLINDKIDLGDFDLESNIGKMLIVFFSALGDTFPFLFRDG